MNMNATAVVKFNARLRIAEFRKCYIHVSNVILQVLNIAHKMCCVYMHF